MSGVRSTSTDAIVAFVIACWLFGHDFVGQDRRGVYCIHCGKRP